MEREILVAKHKIESVPLLEKAYDKREDREILVLDDYWSYRSFVEDKKDLLYVIAPNKARDKWFTIAIKKEKFGIDNRKDFPVEWGGLRDEELEKSDWSEGFSVFVTGHYSWQLLIIKSLQ